MYVFTYIHMYVLTYVHMFNKELLIVYFCCFETCRISITEFLPLFCLFLYRCLLGPLSMSTVIQTSSSHKIILWCNYNNKIIYLYNSWIAFYLLHMHYYCPSYREMSRCLINMYICLCEYPDVYIGFIQWEVKKMNDLGDWTPIYGGLRNGQMV